MKVFILFLRLTVFCRWLNHLPRFCVDLLDLSLLFIVFRCQIILVARLIFRVLLGYRLRSISILNLSVLGESEAGINLGSISIVSLRSIKIVSLILIGDSRAEKFLLELSMVRRIYWIISGKHRVWWWPRLLINLALIETLVLDIVLEQLDLLTSSSCCLMIARPNIFLLLLLQHLNLTLHLL